MTTASPSELAKAVDAMLSVHDAWVANEQETENKPPDALCAACEGLFTTLRKSTIEARDRALAKSVTAFEAAYRAYDSGMEMRRDGTPLPKFWTSVQDIAFQRKVAGTMVAKRIESVATLRKQGVTDVQLARAIYGHRGVGPFLDADGRILHHLIDQEEREPGSVVPADWMHPVEIERLRLENIASERQNETPPAPSTRNTRSVEGMLRGGAGIEEIAEACRIAPEKVRVIAEVLHIPIQPEKSEVAATN